MKLYLGKVQEYYIRVHDMKLFKKISDNDAAHTLVYKFELKYLSNVLYTVVMHPNLSNNARAV